MESFDVAIVGGGVGGLYTAWRLATSTGLSIKVLEGSNRFGGRYWSCEMPGGYVADMGAMRFIPKVHPILTKFIKEFNLPVFQSASGSHEANTAKHYLRNKHIHQGELQLVYDIPTEDLKYCLTLDVTRNIILPANGDVYKATVVGTDLKAKDMTLHHYASLATSSELLNFGNPSVNGESTLAGLIGFQNLLRVSGVSELTFIDGGFESLIKSAVEKLQSMENVSLKSQFIVSQVEELSDGFLLKSATEESTVKCRRVVFACNKGGLDMMNWVSSSDRRFHLQSCLDKVLQTSIFKLFLTYEKPWWQDYGLFNGSIKTDLAIGQVKGLGEMTEKGGYYTLWASYTTKFVDVFEGLNLPDAERFKNSGGNIPMELTPSRRLVEFVHGQLLRVFGCLHEDIPFPVAAAGKVWSSPMESGVGYRTRVGVDGNELSWKMLKPFDDADMYISGDTFHPSSESGCYSGWSEGSLLNSERILVKYFNLPPYAEDLPLSNNWQ